MEISQEQLDRITKLARMAGFVNGEGCFSLSGTGYASFSVSQHDDIEDLTNFVTVFGGKLYKSGRKYSYQSGKFSKVEFIYATLYPWLSQVKRYQGESVLDRAKELSIERNIKVELRHGTRAKYRAGCRCVSCSQASSAYMRNYRSRL